MNGEGTIIEPSLPCAMAMAMAMLGGNLKLWEGASARNDQVTKLNTLEKLNVATCERELQLAMIKPHSPIP
ncbi:hypothetical protein GCM10011382_29020 [Vreelandella lutescens]|uniref:Uncharacterized protein n=1 Tax=Vreelandella lutescens TaxID=1602943 RepID=A0ABQ1PG42_9GAMM|nr:hypothetical protein GCM10011382_29020 [Halomonas lutescens]